MHTVNCWYFTQSSGRVFVFMMKRFLIVAAFISVLTAASFAQGVSSPKAEAILEETIAALGGKAFQTVSTLEEKGRAYSFRRDKMVGRAIIRIVTKYPSPEKAPPGAPAFLEHQYYGEKEETAAITLYDRTFDITYRGYTPVDEENTARIREGRLHNFFYIARQRLPREKYIVEYIGTDIVRNQPAVGIRLVDPDFRVTELWVHRTTKLPMRQEFTRRDPKTNLPIQEVTEWDKYREVGEGIQWPLYVLRESRGTKIFEMFTSEVRINPPVKDEVFELPSPAQKVSERKKK